MKPLFQKTILCIALTGCSATITDVGETVEALTCPPPNIDVNRSLAVTDAAVLAKFSFQRVLDAIIASANGTNTSLALYQAWMGTFADCSNPSIDPNGYGIACPRTPEANLANFDPFNQSGPHFAPNALTNRFDLAPKNGSDCGEYRIEYAMINGNGRAFIIFEGRLPNPTPSAGLAGCTPVADFWAQLSTDPSITSRATKLEQFYFTGLPGFEPVVTASHYGLATLSTNASRKGQIRTNFFAQNVTWNLREFQLSKACAPTAACPLVVRHVTVKENPADELFRGTHANAPAFQTAFLDQVRTLSRNQAATIAMTIGNNFNEFESVSSPPNDNNVVYQLFTQQSFRDQIQTKIVNPNLTVDNILDRATTQTCAGCHKKSQGTHAQLGDGVVWPAVQFVHIDENSLLSGALTGTFLPFRLQVLKSFLNAQCNGTHIADDGSNLGGGALDAAN